MRLEVNISKKLGVINITSNSFVLEDLKTYICKKMKLNETDFKMKISFGDVPKVDMIEVKKESIISKKQDKQVETINVFFEGDKHKNICSSVDWNLPQKYRRDFYKLKYKTKCLKLTNYTARWIQFMQHPPHLKTMEVYENIRKDGVDHSEKLLYKIRSIIKPRRTPKGSQDSDYREWIEAQKEFLSYFWSGREMSSISDFNKDTPIYVSTLSDNDRLELVKQNQQAWENIQDYRFIFRITSLYISIKDSEVYISSKNGFKYKAFDMKSESSVSDFMKKELI